MAAASSTAVELEYDDDEPLAGNLQNLVEQKSLKWIFVGGKGGVGKTTTSCSLAVMLAKQRESVLLISTDPAHNLSDAFGQKFSSVATKVNGFNNLSAMEIDPTVKIDGATSDALDMDAESKGLLSEIAASVPGIDEAMSFAEMMKQVQSMNFSVIVFDTAPTGHTLRLLKFPSVLQKGFQKLMTLKQKFSGIFQQMSSVVGQSAGEMPSEEQVLQRLEATKKIIDSVHAQFQDPDATTFVCVCIPEFLSLFETERLVQELSKFDIDTHNIVVNQVLEPEKDSTCKKCAARVRMQRKYLDQIQDLYDDFHVTVVPQLEDEVRGPNGLDVFSKLLLNPPKWP